MAARSITPPPSPDWLALKPKIPVPEAAALNDLSEDTFRRRLFSPDQASFATSRRR